MFAEVDQDHNGSIDWYLRTQSPKPEALNSEIAALSCVFASVFHLPPYQFLACLFPVVRICMRMCVRLQPAPANAKILRNNAYADASESASVHEGWGCVSERN